ncbi:unnamed protein product [Caenorhabditis auriculariae]|uniref:Uncharacterized protein n=1 Tax=Caenorhabditis auriculariae TaxID=2777116 RepID=A0A8S1HSI0_9PELO|nr:unnamed protein product [Caenorhabditis auriculariae]
MIMIIFLESKNVMRIAMWADNRYKIGSFSERIIGFFLVLLLYEVIARKLSQVGCEFEYWSETVSMQEHLENRNRNATATPRAIPTAARNTYFHVYRSIVP